MLDYGPANAYAMDELNRVLPRYFEVVEDVFLFNRLMVKNSFHEAGLGRPAACTNTIANGKIQHQHTGAGSCRTG
jgi:hypothetical protein